MFNYYGMMGGFSGGLTMILLWIVMVLGIVALWKYISKKQG